LTYAEDYGYDVLSRLTSVARGDEQSYYAYDAVGNRTLEQASNAVRHGVYDEANRLMSLEGGGRMKVLGILDEPGSVTVNGVQARMLGGNRFEATADVSQQSSTIAITAIDASGNARTRSYRVPIDNSSATYEYDANGSLTKKTEGDVVWTYEWNVQNKLE